MPPALEVEPGFIFVAVQVRALSYHSVMSEEAKQTSAPAPASTMEVKSDSTASPPPAQGVSSVSPPVSTVTQPAPPATEDEEEESEDESEILEESPCGRWQKRREEVQIGVQLIDFNLFSFFNGFIPLRLLFEGEFMEVFIGSLLSVCFF